MSPQSAADYRAQGSATASTLFDLSRGMRWTTISPGSADSEVDYADMPELEPVPDTASGRSVNGDSRISRLEQYLVVIVDGERMFFRVSIWVEPGRQGLPPRPYVLVDHMDDETLFGGSSAYDTDTWFVFATHVEEALRDELSRALYGAFRDREERRGVRRAATAGR